jgi:hypothetical protein
MSASTPAVDRSPANWILFMFAALAACGVAGVLLDLQLESYLLPYRWGPDKDTPITQLRPPRQAEAMNQLRVTSLQGGAIALGVLAGALAFALCLVDAFKLGRPSSFFMTPLGAVLGGAAGAGGGFLAMWLHLRFESVSGATPTLTEAIMLQAAAWVCAGLGIALGVWVASLGRRALVDTIVGGILAGVFVGAIYPPLTSVVFPSENTDRLFPEKGLFPGDVAAGPTAAFLFWAIFTGVLYSVVLGGVGRRAPEPVAENLPSDRPVTV